MFIFPDIQLKLKTETLKKSTLTSEIHLCLLRKVNKKMFSSV